MANEVHFTISIHDVSGLFWERLFRRHLAELPAIVDSITKAFAHAANQEATSDYTTGSVGLGSAVCLALLARQRKAATVVEIGTYVGRSAFALAVGMEALPDATRLYTCDADGDSFVPMSGLKTAIRSFPFTLSTQMLTTLCEEGHDGAVDLFFLDGRVQDKDVALLERLMRPDAVVALDDFEGLEKGVVNALRLQQSLREHMLVHPAPPELLARFGIADRSLVACLVSRRSFAITPQ